MESNILDGALAVVIAMAIAIGVLVGSVRSFLLLISLYLGLISAARVYEAVGQGLSLFFGPLHLEFYRAVAYAVLLVLVTLILMGASFSSYPYASTKLHSAPRLDRALGAALGLLSGPLLAAGLLIAVQFLAVVAWPTANQETRETLAQTVQFSALRKQLREAPLLPPVIDPWVPGPAYNRLWQ